MITAKIIFIFGLLLPFMPQQDYSKIREAMVKTQLEARGIQDSAILAAMRKVPRHKFVPANQAAYAYEDRPLPIGYGQTISQPFIVAYMTEMVKPQAGQTRCGRNGAAHWGQVFN